MVPRLSFRNLELTRSQRGLATAGGDTVPADADRCERRLGEKAPPWQSSSRPNDEASNSISPFAGAVDLPAAHPAGTDPLRESFAAFFIKRWQSERTNRQKS